MAGPRFYWLQTTIELAYKLMRKRKGHKRKKFKIESKRKRTGSRKQRFYASTPLTRKLETEESRGGEKPSIIHSTRRGSTTPRKGSRTSKNKSGNNIVNPEQIQRAMLTGISRKIQVNKARGQNMVANIVAHKKHKEGFTIWS